MGWYNVILCGEKLKASIAEGAIGPKSLQLLHVSSTGRYRTFLQTCVNFLPCKNNFGLLCFPCDTLKISSKQPLGFDKGLHSLLATFLYEKATASSLPCQAAGASAGWRRSERGSAGTAKKLSRCPSLAGFTRQRGAMAIRLNAVAGELKKVNEYTGILIAIIVISRQKRQKQDHRNQIRNR